MRSAVSSTDAITLQQYFLKDNICKSGDNERDAWLKGSEESLTKVWDKADDYAFNNTAKA